MKLLRETLALVVLTACTVSFAADEQDETQELPERYLQLDIEPVEQISAQRWGSFREVDRQSLIMDTKRREAFLLVFNAEIPKRIDSVDMRRRNIRAGFSRVCVIDDMGRTCRRIEAIYPMPNMKKENEIVEFLKAND